MALTKRKTFLVIIFIGLVFVVGDLWWRNLYSCPPFNKSRAFEDLAYQVSLGPRYPESIGHQKTIDWITNSLEEAGWDVEIQVLEINGKIVKNIIARQKNSGPWIILGAHYDTRIYADKDPDIALRTQPMIGANDGASGVAVLLELARVLPKKMDKSIWLVFFDAEDSGGIDGWDWAMGSRAFVEQLEGKPDGVVIVDMVGDADLNIYFERASTEKLSQEIWAVAEDIGISAFIDITKYHLIDDHTPFLEKGISAIDIIDFDYAYWHTTEDTLDKVSAESLWMVGETLRVWLLSWGE